MNNNANTSENNTTPAQRRLRRKKRPLPLYIRITTMLCILVTISAVLTLIATIRYYHREKPAVEEEEITTTLDMFSTVDNKDTYSKLEVAQLMEMAREEYTREGREDVLDTIRSALDETQSSIDAFRRVFTDHIVVMNNKQYTFIPIDKDIPPNELSASGFIKNDDGTMDYLDPETDSSDTDPPVKGIDVSSHQGGIDWEKVAESGVEFAIIRVGYRGYSKGEVLDDSEFENNIKGAIDNGIHTGVYFFTQAINEAEMKEEVAYITEHMSDYDTGGPIVLDVEPVESSDGGRAASLTPEERTGLIRLFCNEVEKAGYTPMLYGNLHSTMLMMEYKELADIDLWYAYYSYPIYYPYRYKMLQYSSTGRIPGIKTDVDLNLCFDPWW